MAKDFYSPKEIFFTRKEALWVIQNLGTLQAGYWPTEESGYIDDTPIGKRSLSHKAPFISPIECAAEITDRMERCGIDGLILLAIECWGESEEALSKYFNIPIWSIKKRYKRALAYVASGPVRRWHDKYDKKGKLRKKAETYEQFKSRPKKNTKTQ